TSHTSLSHFEGQILSKTDNSITKIMLHGLTQKPVAELVPLAKSWISPPKVETKGDGFTSNGYDVTQRAFVFTRSNGSAALRATLQASVDSPAIHPALVVKNWGGGIPRLKVDGKSVAWGPNSRFGHEHSLDGTSLVVWMNIESTKPVTVEIQ